MGQHQTKAEPALELARHLAVPNDIINLVKKELRPRQLLLCGGSHCRGPTSAAWTFRLDGGSDHRWVLDSAPDAIENCALIFEQRTKLWWCLGGNVDDMGQADDEG